MERAMLTWSQTPVIRVMMVQDLEEVEKENKRPTDYPEKGQRML